MGQKVNPIAFRLAVNKDWRSKWYASGKDYTDKLHEDLAIRGYLKNKLQNAGLARVVIERAWNSVRVTLHTSRPGLIIGRQGKEIEIMTRDITNLAKGAQVKIDIVEIRKPELDAQLVAEQIAIQLERRISFRRAMKRALQTAMDFGAEGIRLRCAGRLGGADIARAEGYREGKVPFRLSVSHSTTVSPKPAPFTASSVSNAGSTRKRMTAAHHKDASAEIVVIAEIAVAETAEATVAHRTPATDLIQFHQSLNSHTLL